MRYTKPSVRRSFSVGGLLVSLVVLLGQGCTTSQTTGLDGGVFRTSDQGTTWKQVKTVNLGAKFGSLANVGTVTLAVDPQDPLAIYLGTTENGLMYSLDSGESWMPAKGLTAGKINAIVVDPKDKCTVYAARANAIFKTNNCSRDWNQVFFDPRTDKIFTALAADWFNSRVFYAGSSDGDIFRSDDGGNSWRAINRVEGIRINNIVLDPRDSRIIYVATAGSGILKSVDSGNNWTRIIQPFQDYENARRPSLVVLDPLAAGVVYNVSKYGLLKSEDGGATWKPLTLPTPPGSVNLKSFLIHPKNSKVLVYATDTSIVWSLDGGTTWKPQKLPTSRGTACMIYDTSASPSLFLGAGVATQ